MQSLDEFLGRDNEHLRLRPFQHDDEDYDEIPSEPLYVFYCYSLILCQAKKSVKMRGLLNINNNIDFRC